MDVQLAIEKNRSVQTEAGAKTTFCSIGCLNTFLGFAAPPTGPGGGGGGSAGGRLLGGGKISIVINPPAAWGGGGWPPAKMSEVRQNL
jgi:hypothetical protein